MKPTIILACAVIASGSLLVSCKKSEESPSAGSTPVAETTPAPVPLTAKQKADTIIAQVTAGFEKTLAALESVTDKASAEAAATTIRSASADLSALAPQAKALETELNAEEKQSMQTAATQAMTPFIGRMTEAMQKIMANPELSPIVMPAMMELQKSMISQPAPPTEPTPVPTPGQ